MSNRFRQKRNPNPTNRMLVNSIVQSSLEPLPYHYTVDVKKMSHEMTTSEQLAHLRLVNSLVYRFRFDWWLKFRLLGLGAAIYTGFGIATTFNLLALGIVFAFQILVFGLMFGTAMLVLGSVLLVVAVFLSGSGDAFAAGGIGMIAAFLSWFVVSMAREIEQTFFEWGRDFTQIIYPVSIEVDRLIYDAEWRVLVGSLVYALVVFTFVQNFLDDSVVNYGWLLFGHITLVLLGFLKNIFLEIVGAFVTRNHERLSEIIESINQGDQGW